MSHGSAKRSATWELSRCSAATDSGLELPVADHVEGDRCFGSGPLLRLAGQIGERGFTCTVR